MNAVPGLHARENLRTNWSK